MAFFKNIGNGVGKCLDGENPGCGSEWRIRITKPLVCPRCHRVFENNKYKDAKK